MRVDVVGAAGDAGAEREGEHGLGDEVHRAEHDALVPGGGDAAQPGAGTEHLDKAVVPAVALEASGDRVAGDVARAVDEAASAAVGELLTSCSARYLLRSYSLRKLCPTLRLSSEKTTVPSGPPAPQTARVDM